MQRLSTAQTTRHSCQDAELQKPPVCAEGAPLNRPELSGAALHRLASDAIVNAKSAGFGLVRVVQCLPLDADPWALLSAPGLRQRIAWAGPDGRVLAATGRAGVFVAEGADRLARLDQVCSALCEQLRSLGPDGGLPLGFVGAAFDDERAEYSAGPVSADGLSASPLPTVEAEAAAEGVLSDGDFAGWPSAALRIPEVIVMRRGQGPLWMAVTMRVSPGAVTATVADTLRAKLAWAYQILASAGAPAPESGLPPTAGKRERPAAPEPIASGFSLPTAIDPRSDWINRVETARSAIAAGRLAKVVLARRVRVVAPPGRVFDALQTAQTLRHQHPDAYTFWVEHSDGSAFVGASPETLLRVSGRRVETQSVAGTAPRGRDESEDRALGARLLASPKDRLEQSIVTDALVEGLAPTCESLEVAKTPQLIRLRQLQHLMTPIRGILHDRIGLLSLAARIHPTPAVGGYPREAARAFLRTADGAWFRGWYAAPIGWVDPGGGGVLAVAIRSALLRGSQATLFLGAGIVAESSAAAEWEETALKSRTVVAALMTEPAHPERPAVTHD